MTRSTKGAQSRRRSPDPTVRVTPPSLKDRRRENDRRRLATPRGRALRLMRDCRYRSKLKGLPPPTLDVDDLTRRIEAGRCEATGIPFELFRRQSGGRADAFAPSLDRLDQTRGYHQDNVRVTCVAFNRARSDLGDQTLIAVALALVVQMKLS